MKYLSLQSRSGTKLIAGQKDCSLMSNKHTVCFGDRIQMCLISFAGQLLIVDTVRALRNFSTTYTLADNHLTKLSLNIVRALNERAMIYSAGQRQVDCGFQYGLKSGMVSESW